MPRERDIAKPGHEKLADDYEELRRRLEVEYGRGFHDALKTIVSCLRSAAATVETPTYAEFERRSGVGNAVGGVFRGVAKTGQPHFAAQLRALASEIEAATLTSQSKGTSDHGTHI